MSTVPHALRRARLWTAGLMTASTVLVGAIGIHLADARTRPVTTQTSFGTSASSSSSSAGTSSSTDPSTTSSSDDDARAADLGSSGSGFSAVAPVGGSNAQPLTSSGGS